VRPAKVTRSAVTIRLANAADAGRLAELSGQLGYPSSCGEILERLAALEREGQHAVFVAERGGVVIGWVHVFALRTVESDPRAEIGGLVVEVAARGSGVGRALMQRAEDWARARKLAVVSLRSNIIRKEAHTFYEALGYTLAKTQHAFRKKL
jgi:GNAT superfamily N-acetyltransferase